MENFPYSIRDFLTKEPFLKGFSHMSFRLDICLHLDESSFFLIKGKDNELIGIIYCGDITESESSLGRGQNIELINDVKGAFRFSRINLLIPRDLSSESKEVPPDTEKEALYAINKFIDSYKLVTRRFGIENLFNLSELPEYNIMIYSPDKPPQGLFRVQFQQGITIRRPLRSNEDIEKINKLTSSPEDLDLVEQFLLDAYKFLARGYNLSAVITAVTALELKYKEFIASLNLDGYSLDDKENELLKSNGNLADKISIVFSKILPNKVDSTVLGGGKNVIEERNDIVHEGKRSLRGNPSEYLISLESLINNMDLKQLLV